MLNRQMWHTIVLILLVLFAVFAVLTMAGASKKYKKKKDFPLSNKSKFTLACPTCGPHLGAPGTVCIPGSLCSPIRCKRHVHSSIGMRVPANRHSNSNGKWHIQNLALPPFDKPIAVGHTGHHIRSGNVHLLLPFALNANPILHDRSG